MQNGSVVFWSKHRETPKVQGKFVPKPKGAVTLNNERSARSMRARGTCGGCFTYLPATGVCGTC